MAESRRATKAARSDLELVLRGLIYALIIQGAVAATGWTQTIVDDVSPKDAWKDHIGELVSFGLVAGILIPTVIGLGLSWWLRRAEVDGQLKPWHYALGGRDYRKAWDYVFGREEGTYLLFTVAEDGGPRHFLAKYGNNSWASQAPTQPHEIYVEKVWPADSDGRVTEDLLVREPSRGMWINSEKIERLEILHLADRDSA